MLYRVAKLGIAAWSHRKARQASAERERAWTLSIQERLGVAVGALPPAEERPPSLLQLARRGLFRGRRLLAPLVPLTAAWAAGAVVSSPEVPAGPVVALAAAVAVLWALVRRRRLTRPAERWYAVTCWVALLGWLLAAAAAGLAGVLVPGVVVWGALSVPWLHHHAPRPRPADPEPVELGDPFVARFEANVSRDGGALPGARLTNPDVTEHYTTYDLELVPGAQGQTPDGVQERMPRIATGTRTPGDRLVQEAHPLLADPSVRVLKVLHQPPRDQVEHLRRPQMTDGAVHLGAHVDGDGDARWRVYGVAEPSIYSGFIVGGQGIGKSRDAELIATTLRSEWCEFRRWPTAIIYVDGQQGASSAALWGHATVALGPDRLDDLFGALAHAAHLRGAYNRAFGLGGFRPGYVPTGPGGQVGEPLTGILVIADEFHMLCPNKARALQWASVVREYRKFGIGAIGLDQSWDLQTFGQLDVLRASFLNGNGIAHRTTSKQAGAVVPGLPTSPDKLPAIPGYGIKLAPPASTERSVAFRTRYMPGPQDADRPADVLTSAEWFERTEDAPIDELTMRALGPLFADLARDREESQAADLALLEGREAPAPRERITVQAPTAPAAPGPARKKPARELIVESLRAHGTRTRAELIADCGGVHPSTVTQAIRSLGDELTRVSDGVYRLAETEPPAEVTGIDALRRRFAG